MIPAAVIIILALSLLTSYFKVNLTSNLKLFYIFKPLTIFLIILIAFILDTDPNSKYSISIKAALLLSFIGDIFLMMDESKFKFGLLFFLIAHIAYSFAFIQNVFSFNYHILIGAVIYSSVMLFILGESISKYRLMVLLYVGVLTLMLWLGVNRYMIFADQKSLLVSIGAVLFVLSDSTLAYKKFKKGKSKLEYVILNSYFIAQLLFAISLK